MYGLLSAQVCKAKSKNLYALAINEDTIKVDLKIWFKVLSQKPNIIYASPKLFNLSGTPFMRLWKDTHFCNCLGAVFVDETHCIDEWGESFWEEYRLLKQLHLYAGFKILIVSCSATISTHTFDIIWESLNFGHRPFWGLDVGTNHDNLLYIICPITNSKKPILDILNIFPSPITPEMSPDSIPKTIFHLASPAACTTYVHELQKCLPAHLHNSVRNFSTGVLEKGKAKMWELFKEGNIQFLVSIEATALGCNDRSIDCCVVVFSATDPKSLSIVAQHWGRTACQNDLLGTCPFLILMQAFRPPPLPPSELSQSQMEAEAGRAKDVYCKTCQIA